MELQSGMHLILKKTHPCGSREWELLRAGADVKLKCCGCGRIILLPRREAEKAVVLPRGEA